MKTATYSSKGIFQPSSHSTSKLEPKVSKFLGVIEKLWHTITVVDVEPRIHQQYDRYGKSEWRVFDPITSQTFSFDSEGDVCVWLEQRYYA